MTTSSLLAIVGGSGLDQLDGLADARWPRVDTPWGAPSDDILGGTLDGVRLAFLPRHGRGHRIAPSAINHRANIAALKQFGATDLRSLSAVGSLRADLPPGTFVVEQFIGRTTSRAASFLVAGVAAPIAADAAAPTCACRRALDAALITAPEARDPALVERLRVVAGRALGTAP